MCRIFPAQCRYCSCHTAGFLRHSRSHVLDMGIGGLGKGGGCGRRVGGLVGGVEVRCGLRRGRGWQRTGLGEVIRWGGVWGGVLWEELGQAVEWEWGGNCVEKWSQEYFCLAAKRLTKLYHQCYEQLIILSVVNSLQIQCFLFSRIFSLRRNEVTRARTKLDDLLMVKELVVFFLEIAVC